MILKKRFGRIKKAILEKPYVFYFVFIFLFYIFINTYLNEIYVTFSTLFGSTRLWFLIPFVLFNFLIIPFLVALTINLVVIKSKELKSLKGSGQGALGIFGGIIGGACPACIAGFFPAILGLIGIQSFSLSVLPLKGLEIQFFSLLLLVWAILLLSKDPVCKI